MTARECFLPVEEEDAPSAPENQAGERYRFVKPDNHTNSGPLSSSFWPGSPVALHPPVRGGNSASDATAIPASLAAFLHEFLGERAVRREKSHKAAPDSFRRFRDEF